MLFSRQQLGDIDLFAAWEEDLRNQLYRRLPRCRGLPQSLQLHVAAAVVRGRRAHKQVLEIRQMSLAQSASEVVQLNARTTAAA